MQRGGCTAVKTKIIDVSGVAGLGQSSCRKKHIFGGDMSMVVQIEKPVVEMGSTEKSKTMLLSFVLGFKVNSWLRHNRS